MKEQGTEEDLPIGWEMEFYQGLLATALLFSDGITRIDNMLLLMDKELARENV